MYVVYIIILYFLWQAAAHRGEKSDWPGQEMTGHVSRGADPSPCHLVLYEMLSTLAFIVENKLFIMGWWYNTFI